MHASAPVADGLAGDTEHRVEPTRVTTRGASRSRRRAGALVACAGLVLTFIVAGCAGRSPQPAAVATGSRGTGAPLHAQNEPGAATATSPPIDHVLVILLENKGYDRTFGPGSAAPYLSQTLTAEGKLLTNYYGIGHNSLPNYLALVSGQAPNPYTQADCPYFSPWFGVGVVPPVTQAVGVGCVYPRNVPTVAGQFEAKGLRWAGYAEDMGNDPVRDNDTTCAHPPIGPLSTDPTQQATATDQYATRHNPWVYFQAVLDRPSCQANDVPLTHLTGDLADPSTAPAYALIVPNLCNDGHDATCTGTNVAGTHEGGLHAADLWLQQWVPTILQSPTYQAGRTAVVITFDEAEFPSDSSACCGEIPGPDSPVPGINGMGGGRVGAVVLSPCVTPGTTTGVGYNHYSLLHTVEDQFGLPALGMAAGPGAAPFGPDVFDACG